MDNKSIVPKKSLSEIITQSNRFTQMGLSILDQIEEKEVYINEEVTNDLNEKTWEWVLHTFYDGPCKVESNSQAITQYFSFFNLLNLDCGFTLDSVGNSIYTRKQNQKPTASLDEYRNFFGIENLSLPIDDDEYKLSKLDSIQFENKSLGFYQFAKFCFDAPKSSSMRQTNFYRLLDSKSRLESFIEEYSQNMRIIPEDKIEEFRSLETRPKIISKGNLGEVVMLALMFYPSDIYSIKIGYVHSFIRYPNIFEDITFDVIHDDFNFYTF